MEILPLSVTPEQYQRIQAAEAVAVNKYRGSGGGFARLTVIGTVEECEAFANTPALLIVLDGTEYIGSDVILTENLLPPETPHEAA